VVIPPTTTTPRKSDTEILATPITTPTRTSLPKRAPAVASVPATDKINTRTPDIHKIDTDNLNTDKMNTGNLNTGDHLQHGGDKSTMPDGEHEGYRNENEIRKILEKTNEYIDKREQEDRYIYACMYVCIYIYIHRRAYISEF
jgi:hypothetical protein